MAYTKIDLVEPIYELQEKESARQHYFFDLYLDVESDNLTKFIKSFKGLKKGSEWEYGGCKKLLDFNPPKYNTFVNWTTCFQFKTRRESYWADQIKKNREMRRQKAEKFLQSFQDNLQDELESNKRIADKIELDDKAYPHLKGKGKEHIASANKMTWEMYKEVTGVEVANTDQNINLNLDADVKQQTTADMKVQRLRELREQLDTMDYD